MKKLAVLAIGLMMLTGCSNAMLAVPGGSLDLQNGNKIYAYQDIEPTEKTTVMVVRVEGENSVKEMAKMMGNIENILTDKEK